MITLFHTEYAMLMKGRKNQMGVIQFRYIHIEHYIYCWNKGESNMRKLEMGDTIGIFSPSSPITYTVPERFHRAKAYLEAKGFNIIEAWQENRITTDPAL